MNRQIYKMTISDTADSITFYLLDVPIVKKNVEGTATNTTIDGNVFTDYMWLKDQWEQKWSIMCNPEWSKLDAIYKRQFSDADVPTLKVFYGDNIYTNGSAEGNPLQIINDSEVYEGEIRGFSLYGNATQETLSGKNLLGIPDGTYTNNGITATVVNGEVKLTGTATANSFLSIALPNNIVLSQAWSFSLNNTVYGDSATEVRLVDSDSQFIDVGTTTANNKRQNITTYGTYVRIMFRTSSGVSPNATLRPQVELGSTATDYEPYCGGIPSPNPSYPQDVNVVTRAQTVKITGKNLWGIESEFDKTNATVVFKTMPDGTIEMSGTATATAYSMTSAEALESGNYVVLDAGEYTISQEGAPSYNVRAYVMDIDANTNLSQYVSTDRLSTQFTIDHTVRAIVRLRIASGATTDSTIKMMLVKGSTPESYEAHQETKYLIALNVGANKLDPNMIDGYVNNDGTFNTAHSNGEQRSGFISVKPNTEYTFEIFETTGTATNWIGIGEYRNNGVGTIIQRDVQNYQKYYTFTTTANTNYVVVSARNLATATKVMFSEGGRMTYEAYTPLELAKIGTYQDYIYKSGDKWYKHAEIGKVVLVGTENWNTTSNANAYYITLPDGNIVNVPSTSIPPMMSNYYTPETYSELYDAVWDYATGVHPTNARIMIRNKDCADSDALKTWLSTHNTTVYYALATPTDTEITDAELVGQLEALLAGSLYKGLNNVFLIPSAGAEGTMTMDYRIDYEKETVVQDTMPVKLDLTDGGIINACLCRQNVQVIMRETVK